MLRVTGNVFADQLLNQLQTLQQRQGDYQSAISTGKRIHNPADDPAGYRRSLELQQSQRMTQQLRNNCNQVKTQTEANYAAATELQQIVSRASELGVKANGTYTQSDLNVMASEINGLLERAVNLGNSQLDGQYLFGGNRWQPSDTAKLASRIPFLKADTTVPPDGRIDTVTYSGNEVTQDIEVESGTKLTMNLLGQSTTGNPRGLFINNGTNVFTALISLRNNLEDTTLTKEQKAAAINANVVSLRAVEDNVATVIGQTSASLSVLDATIETHTKKLQSDETTLSQVADTDMTDAVVSLSRTQNAYQAALQTGAQVLNLSLLNFLR